MKLFHFFKTLVVLLIFFILSTVVSCKKYLSIEPKSSFDETFVFGSVLNATNAVLAVYGHLAGDQGYGSRLSQLYTVDTDESLGTTNTSAGGGDNGPKALARYNVTSDNAILEPPFNQMYGGIETANICIKNIPAMDLYNNGSAADKSALRRLYGECLALRAQFYFELIRNWGDIPAPFTPSTDQKDLNLPKTDRDIIYDRILDDLKTAEDLVPWRNESGVAVDERIKKGGIKAMRAKIALFRGGYSLRSATNLMERRSDYLDYYKIARDECKEIMDSQRHKLNPSFESVFKGYIDAHAIEPNGEVLFEVALAGGLSATDGRLGNSDGPPVGASAGQGVKMIPTYYYAFDPLDLRKDVTVTDYSVTNSNIKMAASTSAIAVLFSGKFRRDWQTNPVQALATPTLYSGVNWPILRYSDVLLMFAEADNELNGSPSADAKAAFEQVRKRGFQGHETSIGVTPTDKDGFFNAIVNERWLEFGGEGVRKYDLIRWNLLGQKITDTKNNLTKMMNGEAPYASLPTVRYYKANSTTMVWLNSMYVPTSITVAPTGYTKVNWTAAISAAFITNIADSFRSNHCELLPLPQALINADPNVKQDYGFK